ncbi:MAG: methyltransferase domain-containing protein [Cyanobacteria bacterium P01_B01_bin.77]
MGVGRISASELDSFIQEVDKLGGPSSARAIDYLSDFSLTFKTKVDESLDPFSEDYCNCQLGLYRELSGRELNQETGEQTTIDVEVHSLGVNPYNSRDINFIAKHARAVLTAIYMANLPTGASVLDMGSGWGLSSEMMAFCGANVTSVDINPLFIELNQKRASRLSLPIHSRLSEFDTYTDEKKYDLVFFYECLHHAVRPWETLKHIAQFVSPAGKIAFSGEPINDIFWKNWGLRLDALSIYCIRKFGWFESGWSEKFLSQAFSYAGFTLNLYPHVGLDNGLVGLATRTSENLNPLESFNLQLTHPTSHLTNIYQHLTNTYNDLTNSHNDLTSTYNSLQESFRSLSEKISHSDQRKLSQSKRRRFTALVRKALHSLRGR